jgi:hypothetical protein
MVPQVIGLMNDEAKRWSRHHSSDLTFLKNGGCG